MALAGVRGSRPVALARPSCPRSTVHLGLAFGRTASESRGGGALAGARQRSCIGRRATALLPLGRAPASALPPGCPPSASSSSSAPAHGSRRRFGASALAQSPSASSPTLQTDCTFTSASEALSWYARAQGHAAAVGTQSPKLASSRQLADVLRSAVALGASRYDERLSGLVERLVSERHDLPLSVLVDVSMALEEVGGFEEELSRLTSLVVESSSFLPSDVLLAFARTLAVATHRSRLERAGARSPRERDAVPTTGRAAVFRLLGEHVSESMFDAALPALSEALLAIATYHCSRGAGSTPDPALARPWHHDVFSSPAILLAVRRGADEVVATAQAQGGGTSADGLADAPTATEAARALVKVLRAYSLYLLSLPRGRFDVAAAIAGSADARSAVAGAAAASVPGELALLLRPRLSELLARDLARTLDAFVALHRHGLRLDADSAALCGEAAAELGRRASELWLIDIVYALQALAAVQSPGSAGESAAVSVDAEAVQALLAEVPRHVPALGRREALMLLRAAPALKKAAPGARDALDAALQLASAELLRELRALRPGDVCAASCALAALRSKDAGLFAGLQQTLIANLEQYRPRELAHSLGSFARARRLEHGTCKAARGKILRDLLAFEPREVAMSLWAFARLSHLNKPFIAGVQEHLKRQRAEELAPADVSMLLWSLGRLDVPVDPEVLSTLVHYVSMRNRDFSAKASIVTCLAFARLGFAQQTVLVDVYRGLYPRLPELNDSQLAFCFFLFSTSGVRDDALVARFLYECGERAGRLRGQDLANVVLACSRVVSPEACAERFGLREKLSTQVREHQAGMAATPLLGVYLAAPTLLSLPREETIGLADALAPKLGAMGVSELVRALVATARADLAYKPFLLPLCMAIHRARDDLSAPEVIACIWSSYSLGMCKPKFRRSLQYRLLQLVRQREVAARALRDVLPALNHFGLWERLPPGLRRSVWRLASDELRIGLAPPPPGEERSSSSELGWKLPTIEKGHFRRRLRSRRLSQAVGLEALPDVEEEAALADRQGEAELSREQGPATGRSAVDDFVAMVRRL